MGKTPPKEGLRALTVYPEIAKAFLAGTKEPRRFRGQQVQVEHRNQLPPAAVLAAMGVVEDDEGYDLPRKFAPVTIALHAGRPTGALVALVDIVGVALEGADFQWMIGNVRPLDAPLPCRGQLGLWKVPAELARQVTPAAGE